MWSALRKVSRPISQPSCGPLSHDGVLYHDDNDQARILADHFFPSKDHPTTDFHRQIESEVSEIFDRANTSSIQQVTSDEIHGAIYSSGPWKAPGLGKVTNICL